MEDTVGSRLRRLRQKLKKRQWQVAEAIGISRNFLSGIENDSEPYSRTTLTNLSEYYGVTIDELELGAAPIPSQSEIVKEPSEVALVRFWRGLSMEKREMFALLIQSGSDDTKKLR